MDKKLLALQGQGKLSKKFLYRLISRTVISTDGRTCNGASSLELLAVIYLSQIANSHGYVVQFKISEFASSLQCSEREAYVLLSGLISKKYIKCENFDNRRWTGCRNITLLDNDFSKAKYDKSTRYLNTFHFLFDFTNEESVRFLKGLSLYALRLLLFLLYSYNYNNGFNTSADYLCALLCLKNRRLINLYFKELEPVFGDFYKINASKRRTYGYIHIYSKNNFFIPERRPNDLQLSYYKRKWLLYFLNNKCVVKEQLMYVLNTLFSTVYTYLLEYSLSLEKIESCIRTVIENCNGVISKITLAHILLVLDKECV